MNSTFSHSAFWGAPVAKTSETDNIYYKSIFRQPLSKDWSHENPQSLQEKTCTLMDLIKKRHGNDVAWHWQYQPAVKLWQSTDLELTMDTSTRSAVINPEEMLSHNDGCYFANTTEFHTIFSLLTKSINHKIGDTLAFAELIMLWSISRNNADEIKIQFEAMYKQARVLKYLSQFIFHITEINNRNMETLREDIEIIDLPSHTWTHTLSRPRLFSNPSIGNKGAYTLYVELMVWKVWNCFGRIWVVLNRWKIVNSLTSISFGEIL